MPCENSARKRSKTMAFRCTLEEYELIANMAAWSGMSRQDYIMARLTGTEVTVRPSSRTQRALRDSVKGLAERLLAVCDADELDADLQKQLALVMKIFNGFGEAPAARKARKAREGAQRRSLRDVSVLIPGRDWETQPLPGASARAGAARGRRRDAWATKAISRQFDEKGIYYFHQKGGTP